MFGKDGPTLFELIHQSLVSTRGGYDLLAPKFDATPFRTPDEVLQPALASFGPLDAVLDVCCGSGAAMRLLKPRCRRLVGVDFSPGMLRQAQKKLANTAGGAAVEFVEADVMEMSFEAKFDLALCFGALGHILPRDQRAFLRRIRMALKPGGRFVFVTAYHPPLWSAASLVLRSFNLLMHVRNAVLKPPFIMYYLTFLLPEIQVALEQEGFSVEVRTDFLPEPYQRYCLVIATLRFAGF